MSGCCGAPRAPGVGDGGCSLCRAVGAGRLAPPPPPPCPLTAIYGPTPSCRQRQFVILGNRVPTTAPDTWVAPNAVVVGDVDLYERVR